MTSIKDTILYWDEESYRDLKNQVKRQEKTCFSTDENALIRRHKKPTQTAREENDNMSSGCNREDICNECKGSELNSNTTSQYDIERVSHERDNIKKFEKSW